MAIDSRDDRNSEDTLREYLESELSEDALARFDLAGELWDSGAMETMIERGDFSDLPPAVRVDADGDRDNVDPTEECRRREYTIGRTCSYTSRQHGPWLVYIDGRPTV